MLVQVLELLHLLPVDHCLGLALLVLGEAELGGDADVALVGGLRPLLLCLEGQLHTHPFLRPAAPREGLAGWSLLANFRPMRVEVRGKLIRLQISSEFPLPPHVLRPIQGSKLCPLMDAILLKRIPRLHLTPTPDDVNPRLHVLETNGLYLTSEDFDRTLRASHIITCEYDISNASSEETVLQGRVVEVQERIVDLARVLFHLYLGLARGLELNGRFGLFRRCEFVGLVLLGIAFKRDDLFSRGILNHLLFRFLLHHLLDFFDLDIQVDLLPKIPHLLHVRLLDLLLVDAINILNGAIAVQLP